MELRNELRNRSLILLVGCLFVAACQQMAPVKGVRVIESKVESTISTTTTGTVTADQLAVLAFGTVGRVEKLFVKAGATVKKGELLAKLENRDFSSAYETAQKEWKRNQELFKDGLVSKSALDDSEKMFESAKANLDKTEIKAPFDGLITDNNLQVGEQAQATFTSEKPPLRIVDLKPRTIKGEVDEVDLSKVHVGSKARIKIPAIRAESFAAYVDRVVPYISTTKDQDRTAQIELKMTDNDASIPVGASAEIEIIIAEKEHTLSIPSRAILGFTGPGSPRYTFKWVDGRITRTDIKIGIGNYDRTEIISGLSVGDTVVMPGDVELKDGMRAKIELQP